MSSYSIQIAKYLLSDILVTSMRVNRHAEIIFLKLLSSIVRIFTNLLKNGVLSSSDFIHYSAQ